MIISITGLGNVGTTIVNRLLSIPTEHSYCINIIDPSDTIEGSFLDLEHAANIRKQHGLKLNDFSLFEQSDVIFHTAGSNVPLGANRLSIARDSIDITYDIFQGYQFKKDLQIIVISNPVDVISYYTWKASGIAPQNVIGTGTFLDTIRFEDALAKQFNTSRRKISSLMIGEHGRSVVPLISHSDVDGINIEEFPKHLNRAIWDTVDAAKRICLTQGATKYGVSACAIRIFEALKEGKDLYNVALGVKTQLEHEYILSSRTIYISLPVYIKKGKLFYESLEGLYENELKQLIKSAKIIEKHTYDYVPVLN